MEERSKPRVIIQVLILALLIIFWWVHLDYDVNGPAKLLLWTGFVFYGVAWFLEVISAWRLFNVFGSAGKAVAKIEVTESGHPQYLERLHTTALLLQGIAAFSLDIKEEDIGNYEGGQWFRNFFALAVIVLNVIDKIHLLRMIWPAAEEEQQPEEASRGQGTESSDANPATYDPDKIKNGKVYVF